MQTTPRNMTTGAAYDGLPDCETFQLDSVESIQEAIRESAEMGQVVYPVGGGTSLHYGVPPKEPGRVVDLSRLNRVIDYPARDLTVTVEAGTPWKRVEETLAEEGQEIPFDVPQADEATVGGVVATAWSGPRRLAYGAVRDFVIGIEAVDGQGRRFHGGGRVVKNVAGYDFCKLLTGSLGTLGIITQVTLKVRPRPEHSEWVAIGLRCVEEVGEWTERLSASPLRPVTIAAVSGAFWSDLPPIGRHVGGEQDALLLLGFEGSPEEVAWMQERLGKMMPAGAGAKETIAAGDEAVEVRSALSGFAARTGSPLVVRAKTVSSGVVELTRRARELDGACSLYLDAACGVVDIGFSEVPSGGLSQVMLQTLQPAAAKQLGHAQVLHYETPDELTHQVVWGELGIPWHVMQQVKQAFDPADILNRGRFVW